MALFLAGCVTSGVIFVVALIAMNALDSRRKVIGALLEQMNTMHDRFMAADWREFAVDRRARAAQNLDLATNIIPRHVVGDAFEDA